jgi:glycine cleavage system T protein (aminomethyltransferase)
MAFDASALTADFGDPTGEARACRSDCALFDFSFLERARISGKGAPDFVASFSGRPLAHLRTNEIAYAVRVDSTGHALSDLTVWRVGEETFEIMSGRHQDIADLLSAASANVSVENLTDESAVFSVQGPNALNALRQLGDVHTIGQLRYFTFGPLLLGGIPCTAGRLGYTGEPGFEIVTSRAKAEDLWLCLAKKVRPAGFIAADILRIEAGFVLFANEFLLPVSPAEAGLGRFHPAAKPAHATVRLVSFRAEANVVKFPWRPTSMLDRPTEMNSITVTSACNSIVAGGILGLGYVRAGYDGTAPLRDATDSFRNIRPTAMPFYDTKKHRPRQAWRQGPSS